MDFNHDIEACLEVLRSGGTILYPTDTVWGLGCDATNEAAVQRLFELKQRPRNKQMILLLADERELLKWVTQPDFAVFDYLRTVSKPTTVIYDGVVGVAPSVIAEDGSAAFRIVREPFCKTLIKRLRRPLVSTSANLSGEPTPRIYADIPDAVKSGVDYVVEYRRDDAFAGAPSAVVRWSAGGQVTILRE